METLPDMPAVVRLTCCFASGEGAALVLARAEEANKPMVAAMEVAREEAREAREEKAAEKAAEKGAEKAAEREALNER